MSPKRYLTTTLPYVNAEPHLGFALELVQADAIARWRQSSGAEIFFNTGTDEHGLKIYQRACAAGLEPQIFADEASRRFRDLLPVLGILPEANFIRTSSSPHLEAAKEFWRRSRAAGDIYKKKYQIKYCVGCELAKTESELINGRCPLHLGEPLELFEEENYFFRFSRHQDALLKLYADQPDFVVPAVRFNEVKAFVKRGLQDFSVSRLKTKMPWGVAVPDEEASLPAGRQVIYVWFDALVNYISALGWPASADATAGKPATFWDWWPALQFAGKDNLRQQAAMWPAMLISVGLPPPRQIVIHGFIISGGQKMSKSLGNVIDPFSLVSEYGTDAVRYFLLRHVHPFEDTDVTPEKFKEAYNAHLANGLGNLVSRIMKMAVDSGVRAEENYSPLTANPDLESYEFNKAMDRIWRLISEADQIIQMKQPFSLIKVNRRQAETDIGSLLIFLSDIASLLQPFMPETADTIAGLIRSNQIPATPLFPRK